MSGVRARSKGSERGLGAPEFAEIKHGLVDAYLGGNIVKKRIRLPGQGKRKGFRAILATNYRDRSYFMYGFAKNERTNIDPVELRMLKQLATALLAMDELQIQRALSHGTLEELIDDQ